MSYHSPSILMNHRGVVKKKMKKIQKIYTRGKKPGRVKKVEKDWNGCLQSLSFCGTMGLREGAQALQEVFSPPL